MLPEHKRLPGAARIAAAVLLGVGCATVSGCYLLQLAAGQLEIARSRQPIAGLIAEPGTPGPLRDRLEYVTRVRHFAVESLGLPDNGSFTSYVELHRPYVAWNVFAAGEFSIKPRTWCFPIAGCISYRGYFSERRARDYAAGLKRSGYDVFVAPVAAYSTLGHFEDPVLSSSLAYDDASLAALIIHELAHQAVYIPGDSDLNEAFATVVENEGVKRWLAAEGRPQELRTFLERRQQMLAVTGLLETTRKRLETVYETSLGAEQMRAAKAGEFARLNDEYRQLRAGWPAGDNLDWMLPTAPNNARLVAVATYHSCVPALTALLQDLGGDLGQFYQAVRRIGHEPAASRDASWCNRPSAAGVPAQAGETAAAAVSGEVAGNDRPHGVGLQPESRKAVAGAHAVDGE